MNTFDSLAKFATLRVLGDVVAPAVASTIAALSNRRTDDDTFNICFIAVYAGKNGEPNRVSAFVSDTQNLIIECPVWENVDFNDSKQIQKISDALNALIEKYEAYPLMLEHLFTTGTCSKCKKSANVMLYVLGDEEADLRYACVPCKLVSKDPVR